MTDDDPVDYKATAFRMTAERNLALAEVERLRAETRGIERARTAYARNFSVVLTKNEHLRAAIKSFIGAPRNCPCWPDCCLDTLQVALDRSGGATTPDNRPDLEEALDVLRGIALACRVIQSSGKASDLKRALASIGKAAASVFKPRPE